MAQCLSEFEDSWGAIQGAEVQPRRKIEKLSRWGSAFFRK